MTIEETHALLATIGEIWGHNRVGEDPARTLELWHQVLAPHSSEKVHQAVMGMVSAGREHAPILPAIIAALAASSTEAPDFDQVAAEIVRAIQTYRPPRDVASRDPYACPPPEWWSHPAIGAYVTPAVWRDWQTAQDGDGTFRAQSRDHYRAAVSRRQRAAQLHAIGADIPAHLTDQPAGPRRITDATLHLASVSTPQEGAAA